LTQTVYIKNVFGINMTRAKSTGVQHLNWWSHLKQRSTV